MSLKTLLHYRLVALTRVLDMPVRRQLLPGSLLEFRGFILDTSSQGHPSARLNISPGPLEFYREIIPSAAATHASPVVEGKVICTTAITVRRENATTKANNRPGCLSNGRSSRVFTLAM